MIEKKFLINFNNIQSNFCFDKEKSIQSHKWDRI